MPAVSVGMPLPRVCLFQAGDTVGTDSGQGWAPTANSFFAISWCQSEVRQAQRPTKPKLGTNCDLGWNLRWEPAVQESPQPGNYSPLVSRVHVATYFFRIVSRLKN